MGLSQATEERRAGYKATSMTCVMHNMRPKADPGTVRMLAYCNTASGERVN